MRSLPETQALLIDALLHGGADRIATAAGVLRPAGGVAAARRLQVYRNNLYASLGAALDAVYPVVARLVGRDFFDQSARRFIAANPSRSGNLHEFGGELPAFLREWPATAALPYLADVAALEWACHRVYHESDAPALDPAALAAVPPEKQAVLGLQLQPASRFVASPYPVLAIWQANQPDADPEATRVSLDDGGVELLVARRALEIEFCRLERAEACWLRALAAGHTLGAATLEALELEPAFELGVTLGRHLRLGSFCRCTFADDASPATPAASAAAAEESR